MTVESYNGVITLIVSGTGQAENQKRSDTFYLYTDNFGVPLSKPTYPVTGAIFSINRKVVSKYLSGQHPPSYNSDHIYTFSVSIPSGQIIFGVNDDETKTFDNSGSYTVVVCQ